MTLIDKVRKLLDNTNVPSDDEIKEYLMRVFEDNEQPPALPKEEYTDVLAKLIAERILNGSKQ